MCEYCEVRLQDSFELYCTSSLNVTALPCIPKAYLVVEQY